MSTPLKRLIEYAILLIYIHMLLQVLIKIAAILDFHAEQWYKNIEKNNY